MATYLDLNALQADPILLSKIEAALWVTLNTIAGEATSTANHSARVGYAIEALKDTPGTARKLLKLALAANAAATTVQIQAATDAALQTIVSNCFNMLAGVSA